VLTFVANDTFSETSDSVNVTVVNVNDPPLDAKITLREEELLRGTGPAGMGQRHGCRPPYGDELTFHWTNNVTASTWSGPLINMSLPIGTYMMTLKVTDKDGKFTEVTQIVYILKAPEVEHNVTDDDDDIIVEPPQPKPLWATGGSG